MTDNDDNNLEESMDLTYLTWHDITYPTVFFFTEYTQYQYSIYLSYLESRVDRKNERKKQERSEATWPGLR